MTEEAQGPGGGALARGEFFFGSFFCLDDRRKNEKSG